MTDNPFGKECEAVSSLIIKEEKKVEYLELIYDLIFVYIVGRNNSLLHHTVDGRIAPEMFLTYIICTLAVIQIWNFSTYYINIYGKNGFREHAFLFTNMFLMYFIGEGTHEHWEMHHTQYHIAWALILFNIALQYTMELKNPERAAWHTRSIFTLVIEALLVLAAIPIFKITGEEISYIPILFGIIASFIPAKKENTANIDFAHLSERAMLYVVFTFGEMVIAIANYFNGDLTPNSIYFAFMAFMIVVGLFLSYGTFYDHIIDREQETGGLKYMLIHIFIIFALNNITTSLEFMRDSEMELVPKISFLICSFFVFFIFLFMTRRYAKLTCRPPITFYIKMAGLAAGFITLMILFRENMRVNIAVSVIYVFAVYGVIYRIGRVNAEKDNA